jgi:hypothetical protein
MRRSVHGAAVATVVCVGVAGGCGEVLGIHTLGSPADGGSEGTASDGRADGPGNDAADAETDDAARCTTVSVTQPPPHGGAACVVSDSSACYPHDVSGWSPQWQPPVGPKTGACNSQQVADYYDDCLGPSSTMPACNTWLAGNSDCHACLFTPLGASAYGAIVSGTLTTYLNVAGCIAAVEPCNLGCAEAFNAYFQCSIAACDSDCTTQASGVSCESAALACSACEAFAVPAQCIDAISGAEHPAYAACLQNYPSSYAAVLADVAAELCGP